VKYGMSIISTTNATRRQRRSLRYMIEQLSCLEYQINHAKFSDLFLELRSTLAFTQYNYAIRTAVQDCGFPPRVSYCVWDFLDHGFIDLNQTMGNLYNPLQYCCSKGNLRLVQYLITIPSINMNFFASNPFRSPRPIFIACLANDFNIVQELCSSPELIINYHEYYDGFSPVGIAAKWGFVEIVEVLLDHGADINLCNYHGNNAIMSALVSNVTHMTNRMKVEVIKCLLTHPQSTLNVTRQNQEGHTIYDLLVIHAKEFSSIRTDIEQLIRNGNSITI